MKSYKCLQGKVIRNWWTFYLEKHMSRNGEKSKGSQARCVIKILWQNTFYYVSFIQSDWLPLLCFGSQTHYNACSATKKYKDDSSKCKRTLRNLFTAAECSLLCWQIFTDCLCPFYIFWLVFLRGNYWTISWNLWKHSSWIVLSFVCLYSSSSLKASPVPLRKCIFICSTGRAF